MSGPSAPRRPASPASVPELVRAGAAREPDGEAMVANDGATLTWRAWEGRSNAMARGLVERGTRPGDRVALVFDRARWLDLAVADVAVRKAAGVVVPLAPRFPAADLARILRHGEVGVVVCPPDLAPRDEHDAVLAHPGELEEGQSRATVGVAMDGRQPAEVRYHPGPLRPRRPVVVSQSDLLGGPALLPPGSGARAPGRFLHAFPVGTAAAGEALRHPLRPTGATTVTLASFDPERLCALVAEHGCTGCGLPPALARALLDLGARHRRELSCLDHVVIAGAAGAPGLVAELEGALPDALVLGWDPPPQLAEEQPVVGTVVPVAPSQEGMLWHEQLSPGSFNLAPFVRRLRGALDVAALEAALGAIVARHDALRATFAMLDGSPVHVVADPSPFTLPLVDLSGVPEPGQEAEVGRLVAEARRRPIDLVTGPVVEPTLVRLGARDHVLLVRAHHLSFDDWSVGLFRRELSALYSAFLAGEQSPLPELAQDFSTFCRQQALAVAGPAGDAEQAFWRQELAGAPWSTQLPIGDPRRPPGSPHEAAEPITFELPDDVALAVRTLSRQQRATPFVVMLAAFGVLVQRCTCQDDVVVSTLVANRNRTSLEDLIGGFSKKVLLRLRLSGDPTFAEVVERARHAVVGALAHQDLAYESVVQEALGVGAAGHGLAPHVALKFQAEVGSGQRLELPGITPGPLGFRAASRPVHFLAERGQHPSGRPPWGAGLYGATFLGVTVTGVGPALGLMTEGVYDPSAVTGLLDRFVALIEALVGAPQRRVSEWELEPAQGHVAPHHVDLRGFVVEPDRAEAALAGCPGVAEMAVVVRDDAPDGPGLVAYVVPVPGWAAPTLATLRRDLWARLPGYAWPTAVVAVTAIPRRPDGGVDAQALPPPPGRDGEERVVTPEERFLAAAWAQARHVERVSVDENYWQSFSFLDVLAQAEEAGMSIPLDLVTKNRTVRTLATALAARRVPPATGTGT